MWGEIVDPCPAASKAGMGFVEGTPKLDRSGDVSRLGKPDRALRSLSQSLSHFCETPTVII